MREVMKGGPCIACKVLNPIDVKKNATIRQLQAENLRLKEQIERLKVCNILGGLRIPKPRSPNVPPPTVVSSTDQLGNSLMQLINSNVDSMITSMNPQLDFETRSMIRTIISARYELVSLLHTNALWLKDMMTDGKYIINRSEYDAKFLKTSARESQNLRGSRTRKESSKYEGVLSMSAMEVAEMLMDSKKRRDLFPTIITEATMVHEYKNQATPRQVGPIKLVYEQMHLLTPFFTPREFCFVRICEKVLKGVWLIVEVSHDFLVNKCQVNSPARAWRLPSGCLIKDVSPGVSHVTWIEHVEIDDKVSIHHLYKDVILRGLAFRADRWVQILSRSCHRIGSFKNDSQNQFFCTQQAMGDVMGAMRPEDKECLMRITGKMVKSLCTNMTMKNNIDMPELRDTGIFLSLCQGEEIDNDTSNGVVVIATTSFWLPASFEAVLDFLRNANQRAKWDIFCNGRPGKEIANITFGDQLDNSISMIQPFIENADKVILVQEILVDPLGAVVVYAPHEMEDLNGKLHGSLSRSVLPSGFFISKDGNPLNMHVDFGRASTSTHVVPPGANGSLVTVAFQVVSLSREIEMDFVKVFTSLVTSTVDNIKLAFDCPNSNV
ncbi:homeobox-leucine zipper protein HDG11-like [Impatiens glandulifera]|uniref:homeobox-leucine zipper protein HDG11-like n=1 Tax=Impatiens glandulifera TaxID=253017 RepID=UPI001FB0E8B8|nr:homeobox-leucine zipper protein HDG11-like [Impatiens glandulifera]